MSNLLESILRVGMTVFIVGPLAAWVARRGARERSEATDSLDRFTVRMPAAIRTIIACCAVAFELLMLGVYVWQGVSLGEWDHELVWFGHAMALAGMAIWALLSIPRIDVDGGRILSRNAFGIRKETTFGNITRATLHAQMMRIDLFEGDRKFCSISLEGVCSLNLLARLEEEGIEVSDAVDGPMTKAGLCWSAIKPLTIVFNGMALVFSLVIAFMAVFTDAGARLLLLVPCLFLFIGGLLPLLMLSMPARGIYEIGRQERELGFSFAEEMASRGATGTSLVDDDWFIEISNARVVAFRRDYLKKVTAHEDSESGDRCTVTTKGGRKIKVYAAGSTLEDLRTWFKQGAKASCAAKISAAVDAAILGHDMAMQCRGFRAGEGLIQDTVEETIASMGYVGRVGMKDTDVEILNIMIGKTVVDC